MSRGAEQGDPGPMARLVEVCADAGSVGVIAQRVAGGETLREVCRAWEVPQGAMLAWLMGDDGRWSVYRRALVAGGFAEMDEAKEIADAALPENAGVAKLQVDVRRFRASKHASDYYGERIDVMHHRAPASEEVLLAQLDALIASRPGLMDQLLERRAALALPVADAPAA